MVLERQNLTIAILGCGNMGKAIMRGLFSTQHALSATDIAKTVSRPLSNASINTFCTVNSAQSKSSLISWVESALASHASHVTITRGGNSEAVEASNVTLLACQPSQAQEILGDKDIRQGLRGKILVSICVGMSVEKLRAMLGQATADACHIVHAMPNTASGVQESATILSTGPDPIPEHLEVLVREIFRCIGTVTKVEPDLMNAASVTAASTPAFFALAMEGLIDAAVLKGIERGKATLMVAQAMKGTAELVLQGTGPAAVRESVTTPNGCTARGLEELYGANVKDAYANAIKHGVARVFELGSKY